MGDGEWWNRWNVFVFVFLMILRWDIGVLYISLSFFFFFFFFDPYLRHRSLILVKKQENEKKEQEIVWFHPFRRAFGKLSPPLVEEEDGVVFFFLNLI